MVSFRILAAACGLLACSAALAADPLPRAKPEDVGLSSERLARISAVLKADIEAGRTYGADAALAQIQQRRASSTTSKAAKKRGGIDLNKLPEVPELRFLILTLEQFINDQPTV